MLPTNKQEPVEDLSFAEPLNKFMILAPSASPGESSSFAPVDSGVEEAGDAILPDVGGVWHVAF